MKTKKVVRSNRMPDKKIKKVIAGEVKLKPTSKAQRLVAERNVNKLKKEGWKAVGSAKDEKGRVLNVDTHTSDLVLMEK